MKLTVLCSAVAIALAAISSTASAQTATPAIRKTQIDQQQRIHEGAADGSLTAKETRHLEARQIKIQHDKKVAKSDGVVTQTERRTIKREQRRTSRAIYHQKHDAQVKR